MFQERLLELLSTNSRIGLIVHEKPDGDSVASCIALKLALEKIKILTQIISTDPIPKPFRFLPKVDSIVDNFFPSQYDILIVLDCGNLQRTGFPEKIINFAKSKPLINIDHHPKNDIHKISTLNLIDYNATATVEIIAKLIEKLKISMDKDIATCLMTGLYTDTGGFKHSNTLQNTFTNASRWLSSGAKLSKIIFNLTGQKSIKSLKLFGIACKRIKIQPNLNMAMTVLTQEDLLKTGAQVEEVNGIINQLLALPNIQTVMLFFEINESYIKTTIRSNDFSFDCLKFASIFDGNGKKNAAGFTFTGSVVNGTDNWEINFE